MILEKVINKLSYNIKCMFLFWKMKRLEREAKQRFSEAEIIKGHLAILRKYKVSNIESPES